MARGRRQPASAILYAGVIHVMNLASGAVRSWHNTVSAATLTAAAAGSAAPLSPHPRTPRHRLYVLWLSLVTGQPSGILYRSAASIGPANEGGLVPVLSVDGQAQHWFLVNNPEQFGWISGGKLVQLPIKAKAGLLAINW